VTHATVVVLVEALVSADVPDSVIVLAVLAVGVLISAVSLSASCVVVGDLKPGQKPASPPSPTLGQIVGSGFLFGQRP